ncbi:DUF488 family protein [uncultured Methylibium sp.]|uniref:DUF488 domain-containing protein n=1 Tax=uncultured Methylibium sp. TaxID=381093 RepID=UPI0025DA15D0|nr:DUF488 family protein [uncultured Methylibium sp.]
MTARIVRLGDPREPDEGLRLGSVRRPPRGVPRADIARRDFYDLWLPLLSPSAELVKQAQAAQQPGSAPGAWAAFARRFRAELRVADASQMLDLLAALSHHTNFSLGCYCEHEARCHRSVLRELLVERGARVAG